MKESESMLLTHMGQQTKVVNLSNEEYDVRIDRKSDFGNPFIIGIHGNREEVIRKYKKWILGQPELLARLPELRGQRLGCHCKPLACHGDVLVELIGL